MTSQLHLPNRRHILLGTGSLFAWAYIPRLARASGRDPRLLVVLLRGALDGLATVASVGDPEWLRLRGDDALRLDGPGAGLPLDAFFALNPAMPNLYRMYKESNAAIVHACASPYRERSHFDGQDVLESGMTKPGVTDTGWLNRALSVVDKGDLAEPREAFAVGPMTPLIVRGPAKVLTWTPSKLKPGSQETLARLLDVYRHTDVEMARALEERSGLMSLVKADGVAVPKGGMSMGQAEPKLNRYFTEAGRTAAQYLSRPDGPRIGALSLDGWDTHADEGVKEGRLAKLLGALDDSLGAMKDASGSAWKDMVVAVITEFGRTAKINGSAGTDHGTATAAFLIGGAVKGGRVISDWPGIAPANLLEGRDLKPTVDLRAVLKGVLRDHVGIDEKSLTTVVFPGSEAVKPFAGLIS